MRPKSVTVTAGNTPYYVPLDWLAQSIGVTATPNAATYSVAYTRDSIAEGTDGLNWTDITGMSSATAAASQVIQAATCLRITLATGTSVNVDIVHTDV